jgi:SAM-dependent methyltransferase
MSSATESVIEPAIVLAAYAEPVASGRRVLFIGPAISALPGRLLERGARLVHVCDSDPVRVAEATAKNRSSNVSFSALADGHFALREGAFDVCIVEDAGISDPVALVKKIRKALTPRGVALLASLNPDARVPLLPHRPSGVIALDYYALYDAVKAEFEHVRMLGQAPFVGYVIADFAPEGTPEPSLDTAFLPGGAEEPELFIAVASQQPVELEAFTVVQLPYRSVVSGSAPVDTDALKRSRGEGQALQRKLSEVEAELAGDKKAFAALRSKLSEAEAALAGRDSKLREADAAAAPRDAKLREADAALASRDAKLREAEAALGSRDAKLREADAALASRDAKLREADAALAGRDAKLREAETKVFARDAELSALRQELENKNQQLKQQEANLVQLNSKLKQGPSAEEAATAAAELEGLERALAERGEHVRKLERDLREAERVGKELVRQLPGVSPDSAAETRRKAGESELAQKLAKSQADLIATRWALEAAVRRGGGSETPEA